MNRKDMPLNRERRGGFCGTRTLCKFLPPVGLLSTKRKYILLGNI